MGISFSLHHSNRHVLFEKMIIHEGYSKYIHYTLN